jgi:glycosyltransferase involved in cell wall biosynthesis
MKNLKISDIKLVITVALRKEIPKEWFISRNVPVFNLSALKSGALEQISSSSTGILVVITGVGRKASEEAACWIRNNSSPLFVINIGTCGLTNRKYPLGKWIQPRYVANEYGDNLELDARLPVPYPADVTEVQSLISVEMAALGNLPESWQKHVAIDMECYPQAKVFSNSAFSFHCLKFGTDYSSRDACSDFNKNLGLFIGNVKKVFDFTKVSKNMPEVTVVVPVYNRQQTIKRAIDAILKQSYSPNEIIAVNDSSTDRTKAILESYGDKIKCIHLSRNSGPSKARNAGIRHAPTDWVAFMDSDDCWKKDKLKNQVEYLKKYPYYEVLQSEEIWMRNGIRVNPCKHHKKPVGWIWEPSLERCLVSPSGVLIRKSLLEQYNSFNERLPVCEDYDLWLRISRNHPVGLDPSLSVEKYGGHNDQLSRRYPVMDRFRVRALAGMLENETHPYFRNNIIRVLEKKLKILIKGYEKRHKKKEAEECSEILHSLSKYN